MHHPHKTIMYPRKKPNKTEEIPHQCFFKARYAETNKNKEYANFLLTHFDSDHARGITDRISVTSRVHLFNGTPVEWCTRKQSETSCSNSNSETRAMYTGAFDQNWTRYLFISIGYPIGPPSKLYEDNQATIKIVLVYIITPQDRPLNVPITAIHEIHLGKTFDMVDKISNMQLSDLKSKPHGGKSLSNLIDHDSGDRLYPTPGS